MPGLMLLNENSTRVASAQHMRNNRSDYYDQAYVYCVHLTHGGLWSSLLAQRKLKQNANTRGVSISPVAIAISLVTRAPILFNQSQDA